MSAYTYTTFMIIGLHIFIFFGGGGGKTAKEEGLPFNLARRMMRSVVCKKQTVSFHRQQGDSEEEV